MTTGHRYTFSQWLILAAATGLFLGLIRPRIATIGTLLGIPLAFFVYATVGWPGFLPALVVLWGLGVPLCSKAAQLRGAEDPREIVYDEFTTLPLVYFLAPAYTPGIVVTGFVLHRIFDISKPFGVRHAESLPGGWGIMADDVVAAGYALICMHLLYWAGIF